MHACAETFTPYSEVPNEKRLAIQQASYALRDGVTAMQSALTSAEGLEECPGEDEPEEECVHPEPVEALEQVPPHYHRLQFVCQRMLELRIP